MNTKEAIEKLNGVLPDPLKGVLFNDIIKNDWFDCDFLGMCVKPHTAGMVPFIKYKKGELYLIDRECNQEFFHLICTVSEFLEEAGK